MVNLHRVILLHDTIIINDSVIVYILKRMQTCPIFAIYHLALFRIFFDVQMTNYDESRDFEHITRYG